MRKTIILAIFTLLLSATALVAELVSPYRGGDGFAVTPPVRMEVQQPARAPVRQVHEQESMQA